MSDLELSCGLPPGPDFTDLAVLAEELGYARVWIFDSAPLWEDPFAHLAVAATRTSRIGLATAVLIPSQRSVMAMASGIATIARMSGGRFRACFGTGFTARYAIGKRPMTLDALFEYVVAVRGLLAGEIVLSEGKAIRMLHWPGLTAARPVGVELWLSVTGPKGNARAPEVADGTIGPPHPTLPTATMINGTVLDHDEDPGSDRVRAAIGPWRVVGGHAAYARDGAVASDAIPGGTEWRHQLEALAPEGERHLLAFEGHVTHLTPRDETLLEHGDLQRVVGDRDAIGRQLDALANAGYCEAMYTPSGPDVARELRSFAEANATRRTSR